MTFRDGTVAGVGARVFRISFSGELAYEINVPAAYGRAVWEAFMDAGRRYEITPYGTEAMHVLRAEKGFIIVGQETDGSMTPGDLGLEWLLSKEKDFLGKRSLSRSALLQKDRKQLVGLLAKDPATVLPEGGQIVADPAGPVPMAMIGHVTSSYHSPTLGRSIALAVVRGGRQRKGETVHVSRLDGPLVPAVIADSVFYDPKGSRQDLEDQEVGRALARAKAQPSRQESPLVQVVAAGQAFFQSDAGAVELRERPFLGHVNLRGHQVDPGFLGAVEREIGFKLPAKPNTVAEGRVGAALWLGPDEWLLVTPPVEQAAVVRSLAEALSGVPAAVTDVSSGQTVISVRGPRARDVLAQGCPIDLHRRAFHVGQCAQTHVGKAAATVWPRDDAPTFDLVVRRSFAEYLATWLRDAAENIVTP